MEIAKKKRIFIDAHYMEIGGAEISLIGLLNAIDYEKYDVDLFLYRHTGELMSLIPKRVNLLPEIAEYAQMERPLKNVFIDGYWRQGIARIKGRRKFKKWAKKQAVVPSAAIYEFIDMEIMPTFPSLHYLGEYDLAVNFISFKGHIPSKVKAKKTASWIHTDLSTTNVSAELEEERWNAYDYIVSISKDVTKSFVNVFPKLKDKIVEIENILSPEFVRKRGYEFDINLGETSQNFLSIGRFCEAKNYDNVPDIARRMVAKGLTNLKWYIIGYGGDEPLIRQKIEEAGMVEHVIILGKKDNPYPYIKACDIYVQPSRYEGKSVTVREAQILGKPVAVTAYPTASSQINNGKDGIIVPMDNEECASGLMEFIKNKELRMQITEYLSYADFGNESEITKFYELIG